MWLVVHLLHENDTFLYLFLQRPRTRIAISSAFDLLSSYIHETKELKSILWCNCYAEENSWSTSYMFSVSYFVYGLDPEPLEWSQPSLIHLLLCGLGLIDPERVPTSIYYIHQP